MLVGGFVRDAFLGIVSKDADMEVCGVEPGALKELLERTFGAVKPVGEAFGVLKVMLDGGRELDVAIPRRESKAGKGHAGFLIDSDPSLDAREAARRRDFTVNAMAMDPLTGEVFDPFGGREDLARRLLRVADPATFVEDPLRVLRAMQFAARFEFGVEGESLRLMREMAGRGELAELSSERVTVELEKLLMRAERPSIGFALGRELGVVERLFPELHATIGVPQEPEWHPEGDVWIHTLMVVDEAAKIVRGVAGDLSEMEKRQVVLGALLHDLGKPLTTRVIDGRIRSLGHQEAGEDPVRATCARLAFGKKDVDAAVAVATTHLNAGMLYRAKEKGELDDAAYANAVRKAVKRLGAISWRVLIAASEADFRGRGLMDARTVPYAPGLLFAQTVAEHGLDAEAQRPLLSGQDLIGAFGLSEGPRLGELIRAVEDARDAGTIKTREDAVELVRTLV